MIRFLGASDWWETILEEIEECHVFIAIMSKPYMESLYCITELEYAEALNKPIVPLMIEDCDYPKSLSDKNIQFTKMSMRQDIRDTMLLVVNMFVGLQAEIHNGRFKPPINRPPHPARPVATKPSQAQATFEMAQKAEQEGAYNLADELYEEVSKADPTGLGVQAREAIRRIAVLMTQDVASSNETSIRVTANLSVTPSPKTTVKYILPPPFDWIDIPAGQVSLMRLHDSTRTRLYRVDAFQISKYPITNAQFFEFVREGGYENDRWWSSVGYKIKSGKPLQNYTENGKKDHPVVSVAWYECMAFCSWLSEKTDRMIFLPTEQQWQRAAQGDDSRIYPLG